MVRAHVSIRKVQGSMRDGRLIFTSILTSMVTVKVTGCNQAKSVGGPTVRGYVRTINIRH